MSMSSNECSNRKMTTAFDLINICFSSDIKCRSGEFIIDTLNSVEDTKGNNGETGKIHSDQID